MDEIISYIEDKLDAFIRYLQNFLPATREAPATPRSLIRHEVINPRTIDKSQIIQPQIYSLSNAELRKSRAIRQKEFVSIRPSREIKEAGKE